jgi:hypothetical protein
MLALPNRENSPNKAPSRSLPKGDRKQPGKARHDEIDGVGACRHFLWVAGFNQEHCIVALAKPFHVPRRPPHTRSGEGRLGNGLINRDPAAKLAVDQKLAAWEVVIAMATAFVLTFVAVVFRLLVPTLGTWNFVPMGAVALYAGSRLPRRWAWLVPAVAMVLSDLVLDYGTHRPLFELSRWAIYATFAATTVLGQFANGRLGQSWLLPLLSLGASTLFFLTSNLAVWCEGSLYPLTPAGLAACYWAGVPFFGRTIAADLVGTGLLFDLGPAIERAAQRWTRPRTAEVTK